MDNIRNFCIISHIDHGKSTLADRLLELTGTVEKREMKEQILDSMDLERERGITIKLQPVRMIWKPNHPETRITNIEARNKFESQNPNFPNSFGFRNSDFGFADSVFILNLIDTPGHADFSYEVSRSLAAVEGAILLVDATQGVQAQTLANLELAKSNGLKIIPVVNKIDLPEARPEEVALEISEVLSCNPDDVVFISAKTGEGVEGLLEAIVERIPSPPPGQSGQTRALVFDSFYDDYRGVVVYVRVVDGEITRGDKIIFVHQDKETLASDVGAIQLGLKSQKKITQGEIGYIVTSFKDVTQARVGETITTASTKYEARNTKQILNSNDKNSKLVGHTIPSPSASLPDLDIRNSDLPGRVIPLPGYKEPKPMVFAELYTTSGDDFTRLREGLLKLKLSDAAVRFEPSSSKAFGFGFKCGFLGMLHLEIVKERLEREYDLELVVTTPTVEYKKSESGLMLEPWVKTEVVLPDEYLGRVIELMESRRGIQKNIRHLESKVIVEYEMPLSEVIIDFYDQIKSATSGYGSVSYEIVGYRESDLVELDFFIAAEKIEAFSRMVYRGFAERIARRAVEKMKEFIPRQNFEVKIQAMVGGRILASERIAPFRKDVTEKLYGGDVTRKKKLLEKQKKGKKKMKETGKINIPQEVFLSVLKK